MTFLNIMRSEIKYQMKGIVFWLVILLTIFFLYTQFGIYSSDDLKPSLSSDRTIRVNASREVKYYTGQLSKDLKREKFTKYNIIEQDQDISQRAKDKMKTILNDIKPDEMSYYNKFNQSIKELNEILGGGTIYSEKWRKRLFDTYLSPLREMKKIEQQIKEDLKRDFVINYQIKEEEVVLDQSLKIEIQQILEQFRLEDGVSVKKFNLFKTELEEINRLAGGNTIYGKKWRKIVGREEIYYKQELERLKTKINHGITRAYGRLFADYLGIAAGFFPLFIGAFLISRDRRTGMEELIRVRKINPYLYIGGKIAGVFLILSIFYLLLSLIPTYNFYQICMENGWDFHIFGFVKYTAGWILPTLLFVLAVTVFITEFVGNPLIALGIQLIWLFRSMMPLKGNYSLSKFIIRFNSSESFELYQKAISDILVNRLFYLGLSLVLIVLAARIWQAKNITEKRGYNVLGRLFKI